MKDAQTNRRLPLFLNTRTFASHLVFGPYIWFPIVGGLTWLGGLLALISLWAKAGRPRYRPGEAKVVFISDIGATYKTLFIIICCITASLYILSLFAERWLRHVDRLPVALRFREKVYDWLAIFFGVIGSAALILLSIFDAFNHSTIHWSMTLVFVVGIALSALFQFGEVWSLHKDHPDRRSLLRNAIIKLVVISLAIACAIAFGVTYGLCGGSADAEKGRTAQQCNRITSTSAALEWTVAFILVFYFLTLAADLWPAGRSSNLYMRQLAKWQEKHGEGDDFTGRRAFGEYPDRWRDREWVLRREEYDRNNAIDPATDPALAGAPGTGGYLGDGGAGVGPAAPVWERPSQETTGSIAADQGYTSWNHPRDSIGASSNAPIMSEYSTGAGRR